MSDLGDDFKFLRERSIEKRATNRANSADILTRAGVAFSSHNGGVHLIVKHRGIRVDFWPGTGKWSSRGGRTSRGVFELLKYLGLRRDSAPPDPSLFAPGVDRMNAQVSATAPAPRFIKVREDGVLLPADATEWVAVLDTKQNLMWTVEVLSRRSYKKALEAPKSLTTAGFKDWRLPTVEELFRLADRTRYEPTIDTDFFPETPSSWFWSSTADASSPSDCAWGVSFDGGNSNWLNQAYEGFVRAVRPGQIVGHLA